jgi:peptidyl-prolyl cis-trans isomerase C
MKVRRTIPLTALAAFTAACSQDGAATFNPNLGSATVATVNGKPVPESVVRTYVLATERRNLDDLDPEDRARVINDVIGLELLAQEAEKQGLTASRSLAAQIELQRMQLLARAMATDYAQKNPPSENDIRAIYEENLPRLAGQQFKARHILVQTKSDADVLIAELDRGADFVALAEAHADGPTGPNGGDLGWLTLDSLPPSFAAAIRAMPVGSHSKEPVQTEFGFHVILLEDTRQQEPPALEDIRGNLTDVAERKRLDDYSRTLREGAEVTFAR